MTSYREKTSIREFLNKAPDVPSVEAVERAVRTLIDIGALTEEEDLTAIGRRLATLPMDPRMGKMVLYGLLFNCLDPILTATCAISHRSGPV